MRTSSLGDLIHMLPAISDIAAHVPNLSLDWVVEEAFAEIPAWHPAVNRVIPVAHRRWRQSWFTSQTRAQRRAVCAAIRDAEYDVVLDMQGLLKSIALVRAASGVKHGLDWRSVREMPCSLFYDVRHKVMFYQPAVQRQRQLAAAAFGYTWQGEPDFGLGRFGREHFSVPPYAVIMPSASRDDKLWPAEHWQAVFDVLQSTGLELVLLAGNDREAKRAQDLLEARQGVRIQPKSSLTELAHLMVSARIMVGLDSGLTHLSAALGVDTIGIYKASTPTRTPLVGAGFTASLGDRGKEPSLQTVMSAVTRVLDLNSK